MRFKSNKQNDLASESPRKIKASSIDFFSLTIGVGIFLAFSTKLTNNKMKFLTVSLLSVPSGNLNSIVFLLNFVLEATK